ncbi:unnamed protein product [Peronospora farinosa]|uniref:Elongation of fatty acids protein n=1 Tax=Peronospora farinosa TaxID=134698 RepID=A0AAV0TE05_9STRA|nr:unnamed protein product [Peronospora farinosa]CAI5718189.1 unnamed protein product [Peronospora farinosa]
METFVHTPKLHDEVPALSWMFPFQYERDWEVSWELDFCKDSLLMVVSLSAAYCFLCFAGRRIMRDLKPFNLKVALALWNLGLAMFSAIGAFRTVPFLINTMYRRGVYHSVCAPPTLHYGRGPVALWVLLFIFSKVPELLDTAFIVLRKKPLIFLHWYHHVTVLLFCWHAFATLSASGIYFVAMNYSVHAIMYFYYFLTACGYRPPWARLVTIFQLSQMGVGVAVCGLNVYYMKQGVTCSVDPDNLKWGIIMYSSYFALFLKFFIERYLLQSTNKPAAKKIQ